MPELSPIRPTDDTARALAHRLMAEARFASLGVLQPETGLPVVSRVLIATNRNGQLTTLVSDLAPHTRALRKKPSASLLLGEPGEKGDPLAYPRMTLRADAAFLPKEADGYAVARADFLARHPKSKLYADFPDFNFVVFALREASLNGGFGKAFELSEHDLRLS